MIVQAVLHYPELTKLQLEHKVLHVILNFAFPVAEEITQSSDQVKMKLIPQLIALQEFSKNYLNILMALLF